ncbi:MAG: DUF2779 domain-containing protein [Patescibacteria group bacterium]
MYLTKSHFLAYLDAPMHLWADYNDRFEKPLSIYDQHLLKQGYEVEKYAKEYLENLVSQDNNLELVWQRSFTDKNYEAKSDALIHKLDTDTYDIYEIKSSTEVKKENKYDATFQFLVSNKQIKIDKVFILHLNKEYVRYGKLNINELFVADDVTDKVHELKIEVDIKREKAFEVPQKQDHENIQACYDIKSCRCMSLCHPDLPEFSIFNIPRLSKKKKQALLDLNITLPQDVPDNFKLSYKQSVVVKAAKTNKLQLDRKAIVHELERYEFPLYFLDYETFNSAIPLFDGYKPHQQMVFQYSLHTLEHPDSKLKHTEHLSLGKDDPALSLVKYLKQDISNTGSIIVWNKTFEAGRNKEMAELCPENTDFLLDLNDRMLDLADFVKDGMYVHPRFKGSWSIKNVLPVLVPHLSYANLEIGKGDQAMIAWWDMFNDKDPRPEETENSLLKYCELDTLAMIEVWKELLRQIS